MTDPSTAPPTAPTREHAASHRADTASAAAPRTGDPAHRSLDPVLASEPATPAELAEPVEPAEPVFAEPVVHFSAHAAAQLQTEAATPHRRPRRWWPTALGVLAALTLLATCIAAVYLYRTSQAWEERAQEYLTAGQGVGDDLATTRGELAGARSEIEAVRAQLTTARDRIVQLADEKAQLGDDRETQRQTADYQERVSDAAGRVAHALDQCVHGQNQLIGYLDAQATEAGAGRPAPYDPAELDQFGTDVQALCQAATDANTALQRELAR